MLTIRQQYSSKTGSRNVHLYVLMAGPLALPLRRQKPVPKPHLPRPEISAPLPRLVFRFECECVGVQKPSLSLPLVLG